MSRPDTDFSGIQFKEAAGRDTDTGHPWRRYFARMFDVSLFSIIAMLVLAVPGYILFPGKTDDALLLLSEGWTGKLAAGVASVLLALPSIAILQSLFGTPGKWLFGIKIRNSEGQRLSIASSFHRELLVAAKGMGFGIPLVTAILMILSNLRLGSHGITSWDERLGICVTHTQMNWVGYIKAGFGGLVVIGMILLEVVSNFLPSA